MLTLYHGKIMNAFHQKVSGSRKSLLFIMYMNVGMANATKLLRRCIPMLGGLSTCILYKK